MLPLAITYVRDFALHICCLNSMSFNETQPKYSNGLLTQHNCMYLWQWVQIVQMSQLSHVPQIDIVLLLCRFSNSVFCSSIVLLHCWPLTRTIHLYAFTIQVSSFYIDFWPKPIMSVTYHRCLYFLFLVVLQLMYWYSLFFFILDRFNLILMS